MKQSNYCYNYVAMHDDNLLIVAKDSQQYVTKLKTHFKLRAKGNASYFLGCNMRRKKNGLWVTSASMSKIEQVCGDAP